jgi:hypothetical protein
MLSGLSFRGIYTRNTYPSFYTKILPDSINFKDYSEGIENQWSESTQLTLKNFV